MVMKNSLHSLYYGLLILLALTASSFAAEVTAILNSLTAPAGTGVMLKIEVKDGDARDPVPPTVENFIINPAGRGRQISNFNGVTSSTTSYNFMVGSMVPGDYTIPPFQIQVDGQMMQTPELKLKVTPSANQQPAGLPQSGQANRPDSQAAGDEGDGFIDVELVVKDRKHAWVGEIAPVQIKAWLPDGARVNLASNIQPEGSAFTLHNVSPQPRQSTEIANNKRYLVLTWFGGLSATRAGTHQPDLTLKVHLAVRDRNARARDPFGDPFGMLGNMVQKDVVLTSRRDDAGNIEVRPLPTEDRPADFSGAVGKFAFGALEIPQQWQTGEPQQIGAEITGEGNFNLLNAPAPVPATAWKTYPGDSNFQPRDIASFSGAQAFRYNAVAKKGGAQPLQLAFSFFDPDAGAYRTLQTAASNVQVTGEDLIEKAPAATPAAQPPPAPPADPLAGPHEEDTAATGGPALIFRSSFSWAAGIMLGVLLGSVALGRWRATQQHPERLARLAAEAAVRRAVQEADTLAGSGDVPAFFAAARRALQERMGALWGRPPQAITLADVSDRLPGGSPVLAFFEESDRLLYSPASQPARDSLLTWRTRLQEAMHSLNSPATHG